MSDKFLTTNAVAKMFSVRPYTVREWIKAGKIKGVQINGYWRVASSEVERFAESLYGEN